VSRKIGAFEEGVVASPTTLDESLNYEEKALTANLNQLVAQDWALGAVYRFSQAKLHDRFPEIPTTAAVPAGFPADAKLEATLHRLSLYTIYNHPSGFFAQGEADWYSQDNRGYSTALPPDDFWQFNLFVGYRFSRRRAELRLGLLNMSNQDYHLSPLNLAPDLPRTRTLAVSFKFNF
jgi:outer membrane receptor for ferric coprogen and ferric-rhodotorulic acid